MKLVTAVIQPHRLDEVKKAILALGIRGMTVSQVNGHGRQRGHTEVYRGAEYTVDLLPKVRIEILTPDGEAQATAQTIADAARSGRIGDGKIWISPIEEVIRVRTGDDVSGWKVERVEPRRLVLTQGERSVDFGLFDGAAKAAKAAKPPERRIPRPKVSAPGG